MSSNSKFSSTVIHNNPESSCIYVRSSKRKLKPVHNKYSSPPKISTEDQNKKMFSLSAEEEQSNPKVIILECEDINALSESLCKRPLDPQKCLAPTNERNANGNVFILQQKEHTTSRNMKRKDNNFGTIEDNTVASSSKADFAEPVKVPQLRDIPLLSNPIMNEGQNHAGSVPSGLQLPMSTLLERQPFSPRDRTEETRKTPAKSDSTMSRSMSSNSKFSSTVIHNNPESSCIYVRSSKRKLKPVHNKYSSPPKISTEDQNKKMFSLSAEEEQSNPKVIILECEDINALSESLCKRPLDPQKCLAPTNERNANGNVFILQQKEHTTSRNMKRKDNNFGTIEDNTVASSSKADFAEPVKVPQLRDIPLLSNPIMNEGQNHAGSVPSGLQLPMSTLLERQPFSPRDRTEETRKTPAKSDSTMDGSRTSAFNTIMIAPKSDKFDNIGQNIAAKLRRLPHEQGILAEKLLHDVMYEAAMGMLNRGSRVLNPSPHGTYCGNMTPISSSVSIPNDSLNDFNMYSRLYGFYNQ